jgi:D-beta-D-heptose 7-phosphate kinase/D-beta-D-heptose 1-phosphate adenosyltransferase
MGQIITYDGLKEIRQKYDRIAFCSGCYDVMQSGHVVFFQQCREFADALVVGVGRDSVIRKLKGPKRPINPENNRLYLVAALQDVDYAILNDEDMIMPGKIDYFSIIKQLRPNVLVLNDDDSAVAEKRDLCDKLGIELKLVSRTVPEYLTATSSTEIIEKS